ncbi:MAG: AraC family transcriptional regulator [Verrucomicrobiales bacterium]|nr:AraC family transcriptional regulator [Verrucomicrobiales bacterium]
MPNSNIYVGGAHVRFHQALHLRPRKIGNYRFLFVESGCGEFFFADESLPVHGRTLLLLSPGLREIHYSATEPVSYFYIEFKSPDTLITEPYLKCPGASPHFPTVVYLLQSILRENGETIHLIPAAIELILRSPQSSNNYGEIDPRISRVLQFIDSNLTRPILVSELAREAGISEPQFRRIFRTAMAVGPKEYLLRERMNYARRILQSEGLRIGEVADLLQFETIYQFSNQYKKVHGHSPAQDLTGST